MEELKNLKAFMNGIRSNDKTVVEEIIKESEAEFKKTPKNKREILIDLHNQVNVLVIGEPTNNTFRLIKSRLDDIVSSL